MILSTLDGVPGREIADDLGLVYGNAVRALHVGKDVAALLKNMVGGELAEYTKLLAEAREQAIDRMTDEARARGADAVVGMRFSSCEIASGAAEILVFGTAVRLRPAPSDA